MILFVKYYYAAFSSKRKTNKMRFFSQKRKLKSTNKILSNIELKSNKYLYIYVYITMKHKTILYLFFFVFSFTNNKIIR